MKKHFTSLMKFHLCAMILVTLISVMSFADLLRTKTATPINDILMHAALILSLVFGFLYILSGYDKKASGYFKAFMLMKVLSNIFHLNIAIANRGFDQAAVVLCLKIAVLLVLCFVHDLGKKNSWILFYIILAVDIVYGVMFISKGIMINVVIPDTLANLAVDATIGLAIKGKYDDKDARGTV